MLFASVPQAVGQEGASTLDTGDTAWILTSAALVLFMTPGLALFYGGMARSKNVLGTIMHSFFIIALISVQWLVIGYTLSFGSDVGSFVGGLDYLFLNGVGQTTSSPHDGHRTVFQGIQLVESAGFVPGRDEKHVSACEYLVSQAVIITQEYAYFIWVTVCKLSKGSVVPGLSSAQKDELHIVLHERR